MPQDQRKIEDRIPPSHALAQIDGGRARLGLAVIALCSIFWIAVVWACLKLL